MSRKKNVKNYLEKPIDVIKMLDGKVTWFNINSCAWALIRIPNCQDKSISFSSFNSTFPK
jgi:hypothetical protein